MHTKRIVIKIGSSSLTDELGCLSAEKMSDIAKQVGQICRSQQMEVILVSSGAIACGRNKLGWLGREVSIAEKQAAAAVGQGILMNMYEQIFAREGILIAQVLLTKADVVDKKRMLCIQSTINTLLCHGVVPIVNENDTVAVDEIRFGDNDTLSSLVALLTDAHLLVLLTDIDGFYTANPHVNKDAVRIDDVWEITRELERAASHSTTRVGTGGMQTKLKAAKLAISAGIEVIIAASTESNVVSRIVSGEQIGTRFHVVKSRLPSERTRIEL